MQRRRGSRGSFRGRCYHSRGQQNMEEMYEVLRFIEHGTHCRQSMDCIRGNLLIRYLKERQGIGKSELFGWFRQLCVCVDQYHRCRKQREYRYLNPYSVVVSEEGRLFLLDLEAPENGSVLKQMQKPAVREGFVKPVCEISARGQGADIFAYGKTIQFLLAYAEVHPRLTKWEELRLSRVIARCTGESGKAYADINQVLRDLPAVKEKEQAKTRCGASDSSGMRRRKKLLAAVCACAVVCAFLTLENNGPASGGEISGRAVGGAVLSGGIGPDPGEGLEESDILAAAGKILEDYAASEDQEDLRKVLGMVQEMELDAVRCLAEIYDKLSMEEDAAGAYGRLVQIEKEPGRLEAAWERKSELQELKTAGEENVP